jgi:hypothetical protein
MAAREIVPVQKKDLADNKLKQTKEYRAKDRLPLTDNTVRQPCACGGATNCGIMADAF